MVRFSRISSFRKGQAALEYVLVTAAMLGLIAVMGYVISAVRSSADRTEKLVRSDYP